MPIYDGYQAPSAVSWSSATAINTASAYPTQGYDTIVLTAVTTGTVTGGVLTFEVFDGVTWLACKGFRPDSYLSDSAFTLATATSRSWQFSIAGFTQFRTRLSTVISGAGAVSVTTIVSSAPDVSGVTVGIDPNAPLPAGTNTLGGIMPVPTSAPSNAITPVVTSAAASSLVLKASAGNLYGFEVTNGAT
ncbi:MAG: hypothetical protein KGL35_19330, partial [Bradyrhizobium sp.]|nr:hypothetical protein [Bradyrhizobium sp.]